MAKEDDKSLDELAADLKIAQAATQAAQTMLQNQLAALNLEFPEDETEGDSDRKMSARKTEVEQTTNAVWNGVERVNAKLLPVIEVTAKMRHESYDNFDRARLAAIQVFDDGMANLAKINRGLIEHTSNAMQPIIVGANIADTREVAQDASLMDYLKQNTNAFENVAARISALTELIAKREEAKS